MATKTLQEIMAILEQGGDVPIEDYPEPENKFHRKRKRNKEAAQIYAKKYYQKNKEKLKIAATRYQHTKKNLLSDLTINDWNDALNHFNHRCAYCEAEVKLEKEHIVPVSKGGAFTRLNIIPACRGCNSSKSNRHIHDWYKYTPQYTNDRLLNIIGWLYGKTGVRQVIEKFNIISKLEYV